MGWFVLAAILGFVAHSVWRSLGMPRPRLTAMILADIAGLAVIVIVLLLLLLALSKDVYPHTDWVENRTFTRVLLGLVLGLGAGHVWSLRALPGDIANNARQDDATDQAGAPAFDHKLWLAVWLPLAASILLLALVVPHADNWMVRLSGFKTSLIEIQLTSLSSTSKALKPTQRDTFIRDIVLQALTQFDERIAQDIDFIEKFFLKDIGDRRNQWDTAALNKQEERLTAQLGQLKKLKPYFETVVAPAARCFQQAIGKGLSVERARQHVREFADKLTRLILLERESTSTERATQIEGLHWKIIELLSNAAKDVDDYIDPSEKSLCQLKPLPSAAIPRSTDYDRIPHLDVVRALVLIFVNHDNLALQVLGDADRKNFEDFSALIYRSQFMFFRGDSITKYYADLETVRKRSRSWIDIIDRVNRKHSVNGQEVLTEKLKKRVETVDSVATNNMAYGIAVDVAEGQSAAEHLLPIAEQCVETLKKTENNLEEPDFLDTIGFVTIVAEAHKAKTSSLDTAKIRNAMALLAKAAAIEQANITVKTEKRVEVDYTLLRTIRGHISSARGLLE
jgi:hypothetical protein